MRSSVPCSTWIDSLSLLDIQVVSLKRDYYVSLVCQVDFVRNSPSRKRRGLTVRGLPKHMTIEKTAYVFIWNPESIQKQGFGKWKGRECFRSDWAWLGKPECPLFA